MKTAVNDDLLRSNPVRDAEIIARPRDEGVEELVVFDTAQADALADWCLSSIESEPWALPVLIGLDCGLRRGEIMAVKSTMIDEQTNRLKVNTGITEEDDLLVDKRLKTKRSRRTVVIPDRTIAAVQAIPPAPWRDADQRSAVRGSRRGTRQPGHVHSGGHSIPSSATCRHAR